MKRIRAFALFLVLCLLLSACGGTQTPLERTAKYLKSAVPEPGFGSLDGDWIVFGLARAGADLSDGYFDRYYTAVEAAVPGGRRNPRREPVYRVFPPDPCPHGDRARPAKRRRL